MSFNLTSQNSQGRSRRRCRTRTCTCTCTVSTAEWSAKVGFLLLMLLLVPAPSLSLSFSLALSLSTLPPPASSFSPKDYSTLGSAIATVDSFSAGLELAARFWLPTDDSLPPHFHQAVHHEKRQRWASQLLTQMATTTTTTTTTTIILDDEDDNMSQEPHQILEALSRLIQAAATPHPSSADRLGKEGIWILDSLQAIHTIVGRLHANSSPLLPLFESSSSSSSSTTIDQIDQIVEGIQCLMDRVQALGGASSDDDGYSLDQACRAQWAIQGIQARIRIIDSDSDSDNHHSTILKERVQALPFEIIPLGVDWSRLVLASPPPSTAPETPIIDQQQTVVCDSLLQAIPFAREIIITRQGTEVQERRGTAWIAQEGIGALAYSGKLMEPKPLPPLVERVMRAVEAKIMEQQEEEEEDTENSIIDHHQGSSFFDCALCNHYADGTAACKFHTDPEHGTMWDRTTVVVAAGSDRTFAFKPIETTWEDWDTTGSPSSANNGNNNNNNNKAAATTSLFSGDLVVMRENCNDDFDHAVHAGVSDDPRVSLVLKRAIGPRGHGLPGQGRRSKRKAKYEGGAATTTTS